MHNIRFILKQQTQNFFLHTYIHTYINTCKHMLFSTFSAEMVNSGRHRTFFLHTYIHVYTCYFQLLALKWLAAKRVNTHAGELFSQ